MCCAIKKALVASIVVHLMKRQLAQSLYITKFLRVMWKCCRLEHHYLPATLEANTSLDWLDLVQLLELPLEPLNSMCVLL